MSTSTPSPESPDPSPGGQCTPGALTGLLEASGEALAYYDSQGHRIFANRAYRTQAAPAHAAVTGELVARALGGERVETTHVSGQRWFEVKLLPDATGAGGCVVVVTDVTELRLGEARARDLIRSRAFVDSLIENLPNMVFVKSATDLKFVRFNRAGEDLLGYSREDLIGKSDADFFPPEQAAAFIAKDRAVLQGNRIVDIPQESIQTKQGQRILHTKKIPIIGSGGQPDYLLGISEDITEQVHAEAERLRMIREQIAVEARETEARRMTFLADASMLLASSLDYLTTLKRLAGLAVPELGDWSTVTMLAEDGRPERLAAVHADPAQAPVLEELTRLYPAAADRTEGAWEVIASGRSRYMPVVADDLIVRSARDAGHLALMRRLGCASCMIVPISARGKIHGALTFVSATSARIFGVEDLAIAEELGRRAGIAIDNARLYEAARLAISSRDDFMSIASHELKTPITALKLQIQMTRRRIRPENGVMPDPQRLVEVLEASERQVNRLSHLVEDLLDISRIQSGKMSFVPERVDLTALTAQVIEGHPRVALEPGPAVTVWCDRSRMEQVLVNLVSNAVKYGNRKPVLVQVQADVDGEGRSLARIRVTDQGIGVPPDMRERIFERFERAVSHNNISGLGLGLYIVRSIVQAHRGTIRVESNSAHLGEGSVFTVEFPAEPQENTA